MNNQWFSKVAVWLVIALVLFTVFKQFDRGASTAGQIGYSEFLDEVRSKRIKSVQSCRKAPAAAPRSAPAPPTTRKCAPPPPTSTAAWSAT